MTTSVVLATYNGEKYLQEQLDSIANQTVLPDEMVVVDDASSDATCNVIRRFSKCVSSKMNVILHRNEQNLGVVPSFKRGILKASGDVILLSDQDDIWVKDKVEITLNFFTSNKEIQLLAHAYQIYHSTTNHLKEDRIYPLPKERAIQLQDVLKANIFPGCTLSMRNRFFKKYVEKMNYGIHIHDWYLCLIASYFKKMHYIDKPLIKYRIHDNNTIGIKNSKGFDARSFKRNDVFLSRASLLNEIVKHLRLIDNSQTIYLQHMESQSNFYFRRVQMLTSLSIKRYFKLLVFDFRRYDSIKSIIADAVIVFRIKKRLSGGGNI